MSETLNKIIETQNERIKELEQDVADRDRMIARLEKWFQVAKTWLGAPKDMNLEDDSIFKKAETWDI